MLDKKYDSTWQPASYGISRGSGDFVEIAAVQIGNIGGQSYWSWPGNNYLVLRIYSRKPDGYGVLVSNK